ncbi:MAG: hypothetical protein NC898_03685 [Candidatus Omnitrophica bacterium]|nr:hypothetical protein [Candidatus Omnitrophota bacterium]MCM8793552.1 hypothetical protein [Candidatus Omnitrophota bacterium]
METHTFKEILKKALNDENPTVRTKAQEALNVIENKEREIRKEVEEKTKEYELKQRESEKAGIVSDFERLKEDYKKYRHSDRDRDWLIKAIKDLQKRIRQYFRQYFKESGGDPESGKIRMELEWMLSHLEDRDF